MDMRNEAARLVNPHFAEYDKAFGQIENDEHYDRFITEKQNTVLCIRRNGITMRASVELQGDICGTIDGFPGSKVWVEFKPYYGRI